MNIHYLGRVQPKSLYPWPGERRWNAFKDRLREQFGELVYKVGVDAGFDCPNRDGSKAYGGCAYCSQEGSLSPQQDPKLGILEQIENGRRFNERRYGAKKQIIYFQAFTNTYAPVAVLRERFELALAQPGVVGLSVATRPDCVNAENIEYLAELAERLPFFTVELGLQSAYQNRLQWVNRHESVEDYVKAMEMLRARKVRVITHVILGFPGESLQDMSDTVQLAERCGSEGIKLQMLHVIKGTKLAHIFAKAPFELMTREQYAELLIYLLERLSPQMVIHRLTGETERSALLAPLWVSQKTGFFPWFHSLLEQRNTWQGRLWEGFLAENPGRDSTCASSSSSLPAPASAP